MIKGNANPSLASRPTFASLRRIDIDRIILSMMIRNPQHLPHDISEDDLLDRKKFRYRISELLDYMENMEKGFLVLGEYGSVLTERADDIRVVEGISLSRSWIYASIKAMHKNLGQQVTEVDLDSKVNRVVVNGVDMAYDEAIKLLSIANKPLND